MFCCIDKVRNLSIDIIDMKQQVTLLLAVLLVGLSAMPAEEKVNGIKGYYDFSQQFSMYSGYLTLQEKPLIAAHYVFITSKDKPETDDLVLWLNGGPGCSSMLGFIQEFGPHVLHQGAEQLAPNKNPYAWNAHANMLFIESPPGVGFSVNEDPAYNQYNDTRTSQDNLNALRVWFKKFPQFKNHRFWISGESYAGMYLPELADQILRNQDKIIDGGKLDFKGMMIGNGALNMDLYWRAKVPTKFFESHYFFGPQIKSLISACKWDASDDSNPRCLMGLKLADQQVERINGYNPIGICYNQIYNSTRAPMLRGYKYTPFYRRRATYTNDDEPDCNTDDTGLIKFLNDPDVQKQLNLNSTVWRPCSDRIWDLYTFGTTTIPLFPSFKEAGLKIMLYSGNVDAVVPYVETEGYLEQIGWKVTKPKKSILNPRGSLEGWVTQYENNLSYYIINAAGHMVPCEKPAAALRMFESFIQGKL